MAERIYILDGDSLQPMEEQRFEKEDDLQKLLAEHPHLLDGEQVRPGNPRRWLLVKREMGVPAAASEADRWSLDHLLVDQDAIPTLVEVKRGSNTQIRREVVGQMLDYAANASQFWTLEDLRRSFEETWGDDAHERLRELLQNEDEEPPNADAFWGEVATNLAAKRMRLLFVADAIPIELQRIVEFLNAQFRDNIEALAVEVKQFKGESEGMRSALVPNVIGHTAAAPGKSAAGARVRSKISRSEFFSLLPSDEARDATERLFAVAEKRGAKVEPGDRGFSIRVKLPEEDYRYLVTVAWFYPTDGVFWMGLRNYAFGESSTDNSNPALPAKRQEALRNWVSQFEGDPFGEQHHSPNVVRARIITPQDVAANIDILEARLAQALDDLQAP